MTSPGGSGARWNCHIKVLWLSSNNNAIIDALITQQTFVHISKKKRSINWVLDISINKVCNSTDNTNGDITTEQAWAKCAGQ